MTSFAEAMPLLARHEGVWDGTYSYFNAANEKVDEHASRLLCRITDDPDTPYRPTRRARFSYAFDDFAHLARIAEWSAADADSSEGGDQ